MFDTMPYQRMLIKREAEERRKAMRAVSAAKVRELITCGDFGYYGVSMYSIDHTHNTIMRIDPYNNITMKQYTPEEIEQLTLGEIVRTMGVPKKERISKIEYLPI